MATTTAACCCDEPALCILPEYVDYDIALPSYCSDNICGPASTKVHTPIFVGRLTFNPAVPNDLCQASASYEPGAFTNYETFNQPNCGGPRAGDFSVLTGQTLSLSPFAAHFSSLATDDRWAGFIPYGPTPNATHYMPLFPDSARRPSGYCNRVWAVATLRYGPPRTPQPAFLTCADCPVQCFGELSPRSLCIKVSANSVVFTPDYRVSPSCPLTNLSGRFMMYRGSYGGPAVWSPCTYATFTGPDIETRYDCGDHFEWHNSYTFPSRWSFRAESATTGRVSFVGVGAPMQNVLVTSVAPPTRYPMVGTYTVPGGGDGVLLSGSLTFTVDVAERCLDQPAGTGLTPQFASAGDIPLGIPPAPLMGDGEPPLIPVGEKWNATQPSRGLGDTIAKFTSALGIRPCAGCAGRQNALNRILPYG